MVRIKNASRFNLLEPHKPLSPEGPPLSVAVDQDLEATWELLWHVCEPQATAKGITAKQFGELLADECLLAAQAALFAEWRDFFHRIQRPEAAMSLDQISQIKAMTIAKIKAKLADPSMANLAAKMEPALDAALSKSFGNLRDEMEKTLADIHGEHSTGSTPADSAT